MIMMIVYDEKLVFSTHYTLKSVNSPIVQQADTELLYICQFDPIFATKNRDSQAGDNCIDSEWSLKVVLRIIQVYPST